MEVFRDAEPLRERMKAVRAAGGRVALIPTMGYLHPGHLSLIDTARIHADYVVLYIFVNPTQFNDPADLARYPRDETRDLALLRSHGCDAAFLPAPALIYPPGFQSAVEVSELTRPFEGAFRPGHFRGVTTVLTIFFNLLGPDIAVFGEKDFQQLRVVEQLVVDLKIGTRIVRAPLVRESDGLAMSSRNVRLSAVERRSALAISRGLMRAAEANRSGATAARELLKHYQDGIAQETAVKPEYAAVVSEADLRTMETVSEPARLLVAAFVGSTRLIDNIALVPSNR